MLHKSMSLFMSALSRFLLLFTIVTSGAFAFTSIGSSQRAHSFTCTSTSLDCTSRRKNGFGSSFSGMDMMGRLNVNSLWNGLREENSFGRNTFLASSFGSFDEFDDDDEDEDDDDDDYIDLDDSAVASFRAKMGIEESKDDDKLTQDDDDEDEYEDYPEIISDASLSDVSSVDDLISFATSKSGSNTNEPPSTDWANPIDTSDVAKALNSGICLVANPAKFCEDFSEEKPPSLALLSKFGLTLPPPPDLGPDRRADLLPVLVLLDRHPLKGCHALLLNRRTGYLIGDLESQPMDGDEGSSGPPPNLGAFMIQPLWFGGTSSGMELGGGNAATNGLDMIHVCPAVKGAKQITDDGLFYGGDTSQAQEAMSDPSLDRVMSGFDFKFFVQSTRWLPMQLEKEVRDGSWFVASVSKEVLFKSRDRLGSKRAKPLWTEIMELLGGEYKEVRDKLYGDE